MPSFELSVFALLSIVASTTAWVVAGALYLVPVAGRAKPTWLAVFLSLGGLSAFTQAAHEMGLLQALPLALIVFGGGPFLAAPALYGYATGATNGTEHDARVFLACGAVGLLLGTGWYRSYVADGELFGAAGKLLAASFYLVSTGFCAATARHILSARREVREQFADLSRRTLNWLLFVVAAFVAVLATDAVLGFLLLNASVTTHLAGSITTTALTAALAIVSLSALRQPVLLEQPAVAATKYASSGLSEAELARIAERLDALMRTERPYLESDLSLAGLADRLGVYRHQLSQLLNQTLETNFYEYTNARRIDHAKELLRGSDATVLDIAFASGYANKASFYRAFRELCGQTPTQFRRTVQPLPDSASRS